MVTEQSQMETKKQETKKKGKKKLKFKKAPEAPRRFKSAYMFFSTIKHPEIRRRLTQEGNSSIKTPAVSKIVSKEWKELSQDEREKWNEIARQDKARFEVEKTMYTGPWKVPTKKRSQRDPSAPKRPMSSFLSFSNIRRANAKQENPDKSNADISRILATMWKNASDEEKNVYIDREAVLREEYKIAIAKWRKESEDELQASRLEREEAATLKLKLSSEAKGGPYQEPYAGYDQNGCVGASGQYAYPQQGSAGFGVDPTYPYYSYPSYYRPPQLLSYGGVQEQSPYSCDYNLTQPSSYYGNPTPATYEGSYPYYPPSFQYPHTNYDESQHQEGTDENKAPETSSEYYSNRDPTRYEHSESSSSQTNWKESKE